MLSPADSVILNRVQSGPVDPRNRTVITRFACPTWFILAGPGNPPNDKLISIYAHVQPITRRLPDIAARFG